MSWPVSVGVAILAAAAGTVLAGSIAILAVDWYHITGREGASGYFVVLIGLLGLIIGLIIGFAVAKSLPAEAGFWKALGLALGLIVVLGGAIGGIARFQADVPPTIDGETLMLGVEVRWPAGTPRSPAETHREGFLTLGSVSRFSKIQRSSTRGPLWVEDARLVDDRWVAPGAVDVFTAKGLRFLDIALDSTSVIGFMVPLSGHPGGKELEWSPWEPARPPGTTPWPDSMFSYRFRVQRVSAPVRTQTFGPFDVSTMASYFYDGMFEGRPALAAMATFSIRYRGQQIAAPSGESASFDRADAVTTVAGEEPALLVHLDEEGSPGPTYLAVGGREGVRVERVADYHASPVPLTSDPERFRATSHRETVRGWVERRGFEQPGLYLVGSAVVDTRRMTVRHFSAETEVTWVPAVPPLGLSPDERSFVRFGYQDGTAERPVVAITDLVADTISTLPIDPARMRYATLEVLDPSWLLHHFAWKRIEGVDRLIERSGFVPLAYHGQLSGEGEGRTYQLEPAGEPLRAALIEFLVRELGAERMPADSGAYQQPVRIEGQMVNVAASYNGEYVSVSMAPGAGSGDLIDAIAKRFDAELATGKHDGLFGKPKGD